MKMLSYFEKIAAVFAACGLGFAANAQYITNADFEVEPLELDSSANTFPGWTEAAGSAAVNAPSAITGSHSAKLVFVTAGNLFQNVVDTNNALSQFVFDTDFACNNVGAGSARSFNVNLRHTPSGFNQINIRVVDVEGDSVGDLQIFNNSSWVTVLPNSVTFSSSDTSLSVNHLKVVGHYSDATPTYDVFLTNGNSVAFSALAQSNFHGTKPTTGATLRVISFESGSFAGSAFSVVDNVSIASFGNPNNAPVITSHPASQAILEGASTVTFTAGISGTPPLYAQWLFNSNAIAGATNATLNSSSLTLTNVTPDMAGNYSLFVSNEFGTTISSNATLTVTPVQNTAQMSNIWNLLPGDRPYLAASGNTERGLAYNPTTSSLLVASRAGNSNTIAVLNPEDGSEKHLMNLAGVGGGSIDLDMIGVAEDGVVFAGNATTDASSFSIPYQLYRWDNDSASAAAGLVFSGDPGAGVAPGLRWGDNMAVRGSGADTQILIAPGTGTNVVLLRTTSGFNFQTEIPPAVIAISNAPGGFAQHSIAFGPGTNTFWAKAAGQPLRLVQFDLESNSGTVLFTYPGSAVPGIVAAIAADASQKFLAGLAIETPDNVRLYDISNVTNGPVLRDQELFATDNANPTINGTGSAAFGEDRLFVLDSNNGIKAFLINTNFSPSLPPFSITTVTPQAGPEIVLTWQSVIGREYQVQYKNSLSDVDWSNLGSAITATGTTTSVTNSVSGISSRFYRVQGH